MLNSRLPLAIAVILSLLIALMSYRFLGLGLTFAFPEMLGHIDSRRVAFLLHISLAPVALAIGGVQFFPELRRARKGLHRWLGRIYALAILVSGSAGLVVALGAAGGVSAQAGFALLAILWLMVTANAVRHAIARCIGQHRRWMIYSFALTFAGVTLRLYLLGFMAAGMSYTEASPYLAWLCWLPNLAFAYWWLNKGISNTKWLAAAWLLAGTVYLVMILWSLPTLSHLAGGAPMFDMMPGGYSFTEAQAVLAALGQEGWDFYLTTQQGLDTFFPPLLGLALALSFLRLFQGGVAGFLVILAFLVAGLDLAENLAIAKMLHVGPEGLSAAMAATASWLTVAKSGIATLAYLALLIGLGRAGWRRYSGRASRQFSTSSKAS